MNTLVNIGDIVKLTLEGQNYVYEYNKKSRGCAVGLIVNKYKYKDGDSESNGQDVYDVLISGQVVQSLFRSEIGVV